MYFLKGKRFLAPRNWHCCATKHFPAPKNGIVHQQSAFLCQNSALLANKAFFCPRNLHCSPTKLFSAPEICIVRQQSSFLPQKSALFANKALSCPNFSFIRCQSTSNPSAKGCFSSKKCAIGAPMIGLFPEKQATTSHSTQVFPQAKAPSHPPLYCFSSIKFCLSTKCSIATFA